MKAFEKTPAEILECCRKQKELCDKSNIPHFAPHDGECFTCRKNVYQNYDKGTYIRYGETGERLVTGCPHCNTSYCD